MQKLRFTHSSKLHLDGQITGHHFTLRIIPHDDPAQTIRVDEFIVEPDFDTSIQIDGYGNLLYVGSYDTPHDYFYYRVSGTAVVDAVMGRGNERNEVFYYPSPLTQPEASIEALHATLEPADLTSPILIFERALALCDLVHSTMTYQPGWTDTSTTATGALKLGSGVCQDYAHIFISLLRKDGIAARYVSGFMLGEGMTHAWVEFYDGQTWWSLDPTNNCEAADSYIALARGRDYSDCPIESGIFRGLATQSQTTQVSVRID